MGKNKAWKNKNQAQANSLNDNRQSKNTSSVPTPQNIDHDKPKTDPTLDKTKNQDKKSLPLSAPTPLFSTPPPYYGSGSGQNTGQVPNVWRNPWYKGSNYQPNNLNYQNDYNFQNSQRFQWTPSGSPFHRNYPHYNGTCANQNDFRHPPPLGGNEPRPQLACDKSSHKYKAMGHNQTPRSQSPPNRHGKKFRQESPKDRRAETPKCPKAVDGSEEREDLEKQSKAKEAVQSKVEELRKKLQTKAKRPRTVDGIELGAGEEEINRNQHDEPISKIQRLLDLNVNNDDYREIGTGRVVVSQNSGSNSDQHFLLDVPTGESIEDYCNRTKETSQLNPRSNIPLQRIANQPVPGNPRKKNNSENNNNAPSSSMIDLEKEKQKRLEYEQVAERLKPLVLKKDVAWLSAMVNNSHTNSQRILLSKLLEENRNAISKELNSLRFKETFNPGNEAQSSDLRFNSDELSSSLEIDLVNLPDSLIMTIENLIKKERPEIVFIDDEDEEVFKPDQQQSEEHFCPKMEEVDDDIEEIPVPPKPVPLLIQLDDDNVEEKTQTQSSLSLPTAKPSIQPSPNISRNQPNSHLSSAQPSSILHSSNSTKVQSSSSLNTSYPSSSLSNTNSSSKTSSSLPKSNERLSSNLSSPSQSSNLLYSVAKSSLNLANLNHSSSSNCESSQLSSNFLVAKSSESKTSNLPNHVQSPSMPASLVKTTLPAVLSESQNYDPVPFSNQNVYVQQKDQHPVRVSETQKQSSVSQIHLNILPSSDSFIKSREQQSNLSKKRLTESDCVMTRNVPNSPNLPESANLPQQQKIVETINATKCTSPEILKNPEKMAESSKTATSTKQPKRPTEITRNFENPMKTNKNNEGSTANSKTARGNTENSKTPQQNTKGSTKNKGNSEVLTGKTKNSKPPKGVTNTSKIPSENIKISTESIENPTENDDVTIIEDHSEPTHLPISTLLPMLADEECSIVGELRMLDNSRSELVEQMSKIIEELRGIDERRPALLNRLDYLREFKQEVILAVKLPEHK